MDINRSIRIAVDTGKVSFGAESSKTALMNKQAKLVIVAQNCPTEINIGF